MQNIIQVYICLRFQRAFDDNMCTILVNMKTLFMKIALIFIGNLTEKSIMFNLLDHFPFAYSLKQFLLITVYFSDILCCVISLNF